MSNSAFDALELLELHFVADKVNRTVYGGGQIRSIPSQTR